MKKLLLFASIFVLMSTALNAQVTIGQAKEPDPNAVLDLISSSKGFLPPRVKLENPHNPAPLTAHVVGMVVFNTEKGDSTIVGLYMNSGNQWIALRQAPYLMPNWFFMPSFPINTSTSGFHEVDLWEVYKAQFDNKTQSGVIKSDPNAPRLQPWLDSATDLYYYVVGQDTTVFENVTVSTAGILRYNIPSNKLPNVSDSTFMNIAVVIK